MLGRLSNYASLPDGEPTAVEGQMLALGLQLDFPEADLEMNLGAGDALKTGSLGSSQGV